MSAFPRSPTGTPPNGTVEDRAAPQLLGGLGNWFLFGLLVVQVYVYSYNFPEDRKPIKLMGTKNASLRSVGFSLTDLFVVFGVFLLETLQTALNGADLYYWFASGFGKIDHLTSPYATPFDVPMIGTLVSLTVQFFFMYRILVLSRRRSWWLCVFIFLCSIVSAIAAFIGGIYTHVHGMFSTGRILKILALIWLTGKTISNSLITAAMVFYLVRRRIREDYASSYAMVSHVRLTVETNIITTAVSVASLLMVSLFPDKNWYVCPTSILGKIYSNTLLVSLNNRIAIREKSALISGERARYPAASFPIDTSRSEATTGHSLSDIHNAPETLKIPPIGGLDLHERILNCGA